MILLPDLLKTNIMRTIVTAIYTLSLLLSTFIFGCDPGNQTGSETTNTSVAASQQAFPEHNEHSALTDAEKDKLKSITQFVDSDSNLSSFSKAFKSSGLSKSLNSTGPYTFFIPTNEAFRALHTDTLKNLLKPENKQRLARLLNNHIVAGKLDSETLQHGSRINTMGKEELEVLKQANSIVINGAEVQRADIQSSNGVIHVIDKVLLSDPNKKL
ncbi:fasciclin domain-containing protein [Pontibacter pudoricolor]|uniref:fasciclin domain-containing protein n=1 Tax=Pontibacter pudoricolor TaxID=2694930 RepID=UPI00139183C7|nr:fasciclin domain-containing protein [Pontibacter pudoricolor]